MASYFEWRFVVEEETSPNIWRSTSSHDSQEQAVKVAKDSTRNSRVRQFKTTIITEEKTQREHDMEKGTYISPLTLNVPMVSFFCPAHQDQKVKALATSVPRCNTCHQEMFKGEGMKL